MQPWFWNLKAKNLKYPGIGVGTLMPSYRVAAKQITIFAKTFLLESLQGSEVG